MKIDRIEIFQLGTAWRTLIVIRLSTDTGIEGLGEATIQWGDEAVVPYLRVLFDRYVKGEDPTRTEAIWHRMQRGEYWRPGIVFSTAQSAIDLALHDIVARSFGVPVYSLLGGCQIDRVPAYGNGWFSGQYEPEAYAHAAANAVAMGFRRLKIDPFDATDLRLEFAEARRVAGMVQAVREAVGPDVELYVECHGRLSVEAAIRLARMLEPYGIGWIEEPVPPDDLSGLRQVSIATSLPVAAGERWLSRHMFHEAIDNAAIRIAQPDLSHAGGITEVQKIAALADMASVLVAFHNAASPLLTMIGLQVACATRNFHVLETFDEFAEPHVRAAFLGRPVMEDGYFAVPDVIGFGVELDEYVFSQNPPRANTLDFWQPGWANAGGD
jgi:galactonate dehydratase